MALGAAEARAQAVASSGALPERGIFSGALDPGLLEDLRSWRTKAEQPKPPSGAEIKERVWLKLQGSAVPRAFVDAAFADPRVRELPAVEDGHKPPTKPPTYEEYRRRLLTPERIAKGVRFATDRSALLAEVETRYRVDAKLIAALVGIETYYGSYTGKHGVFNALYTAARRVPRRADFAVGELAALLRLAHADGFDLHTLNGSYAGAFGYAQFIPSSFEKLAVDYDQDGRREHDDWPDVLASVSNYLLRSGYQPGGSVARGSPNWWAVYAYNHSDFYVQAVFDLREEIAKGPPAS